MFDILHRDTPVDRHYFLEASAGTGKTFSIVHLVIRNLLLYAQDESFSLKNILVVTFTRASTRELKSRLLHLLHNILKALQEKDTSAPDYILAILEKGEIEVYKATRAIESAIVCFDQAQIFTIHSFCYKMLLEHAFDANISMHAFEELEHSDLKFKKLKQKIKDFIRYPLDSSKFSGAQLNILLKEYGYQVDSLIQAICLTLSKNIRIEPYFAFKYNANAISELIFEWHTKYSTVNLDSLLEEFKSCAKHYKGVCNRAGEVPKATLLLIEQFLAEILCNTFSSNTLNEWLYRDRLWDILSSFQESNSKKKSTDKEGFGPFYQSIFRDLAPIINTLRNPKIIFAQLLDDFRQRLFEDLSWDERGSSDEILLQMQKSLYQSDSFCSLIQSRYKLAIIDEFQDTDIIQWDIFRSLFLKGQDTNHYIYLVGDPKQSIYAFRKADIYTYLKALEEMGPEYKATLRTNYRSHPYLIQCLNTLFSADSIPSLIELPKIGANLPYIPLLPPLLAEKIDPINDGKGYIHCILAAANKGRSRKWPSVKFEEDSIIPHLAKEISHLVATGKAKWQDIAILVRDRYQALRVKSYFTEHYIPCVTLRNRKLTESPIYQSLCDILRAILYPKNTSFLKIALGSLLIGWEIEHIAELPYKSDIYEFILHQCMDLRALWLEKGIGVCLETFFHSSWKASSHTVLEKLLIDVEGEQLSSHLYQWLEILVEYEKEKSASPKRLLEWLIYASSSEEHSESLKRSSASEYEGVNILTIHMSKGLEFEIVFALGLCCRTIQEEHIIPSSQEDEDLFYILNHKDIGYSTFTKEIDAEKIRQLYVAMTRAKKRLYLILTANLDKKQEISIGQAAPLELFFAKFLDPSNSYEELHEQIASLCLEDYQKILLKLQQEAPISWEIIEGDIPTPDRILSHTHTDLIAPPQIFITDTIQVVHSYTSLQYSLPNLSSSLQIAPKIQPSLEKGRFQIPPGTETGIIFHEILMKWPYEITRFSSLAEIQEITSSFVVGSHLEEWSPAIAEIIYDVLHAELKAGGNSFKFLDIDFSNRYQEIEFLFPWTGKTSIEDFTFSEGFIKGVIDFIFEHQGRYYIIDWKSNYLGNNFESYSTLHMEASFKQHRYDLQAQLYTTALKKYLSHIDSRPFSEIFGGCFFIFLRGITTLNTNSSGMYFLYPTPLAEELLL